MANGLGRPPVGTDRVRIGVPELQHGPDMWFSAQTTNGHAKGSGMHLNWTDYMVFRMEDGLIKELWVYRDRDEARRNAGLEP